MAVEHEEKMKRRWRESPHQACPHSKFHLQLIRKSFSCGLQLAFSKLRSKVISIIMNSLLRKFGMRNGEGVPSSSFKGIFLPFAHMLLLGILISSWSFGRGWRHCPSQNECVIDTHIQRDDSLHPYLIVYTI